MALKLGLNLGYWGIGPQGDEATDIVLAAERAGFDSVWAAESYGSDAVSVLAYLAGKTETIQLGAAILQVPARQPAAAAMAGVTIDALSDGRFIFGFGPSGPQVSEGWYGIPYEKPWGRTREYVEIVKQVVARDGRLEYEGKHFTLPLKEGEGVTGQGKALKLNIHPIRNEIPIYLGAIGRKSVELAAEVADGWIPIFFSVDKWEEAWGEHIEAGLAKSGRSREDLQVSPSVQVAIDGDLDAARGLVKAGLLLYLGGMGSKKTNFYADLTRRFGFAEVADEVQSLYLDGKREEAYAAIPDELVDATAMIGTEDEVADRVKRFADAGVDRMIVSPMHGSQEENVRTLEKLADMVGAGSPAELFNQRPHVRSRRRGHSRPFRCDQRA
jgi:F420-dependent oxidoreductase-like protein